MWKFGIALLVLVLVGGSAHAQSGCGGNPMVPCGGSGGGVTPTGSFTAGDVIVGSTSTGIQDSATLATSGAVAVNGGAALTGVWANTGNFTPGFFTASQGLLYVISTNGETAFYTATRLSDRSLSGGSTIAHAILAQSDSATNVHTVWAQYIQAEMLTGSTGAAIHGFEHSVLNQLAAPSEDPFTPNPNSLSQNGRFDCGIGAGIRSPANCSDAFDILNNGAAYLAGIVFGSTALSTGTFTNPAAISLPAGANGYGIFWYSAAATPTWEMFSNDTTGSAKQMILANTQLLLKDATGTTDFAVSAAAGGQMLVGSSAGTNAGNWWQINGGATGSTVAMTAQGTSDTNINMTFTPKGTGSFTIHPGTDSTSALLVQNAAATFTALRVDVVNFRTSVLNGNTGTTSQAQLAFGNSTSGTEAGIYLNGGSFSGGQGANALQIFNAAGQSIVVGTGSEVIKFGSSGAFTANGAVATAMSSLGPTGSHATIQEWFTVTDNAGVVRYIPAF